VRQIKSSTGKMSQRRREPCRGPENEGKVRKGFEVEITKCEPGKNGIPAGGKAEARTEECKACRVPTSISSASRGFPGG
jgi:hypothetical protein